MRLTEVVVVGEDPQAVHLQGGVTCDGEGFSGVLLESMTDEPIEEVDREEGIGDGTRCGGGGSAVDERAQAREV